MDFAVTIDDGSGPLALVRSLHYDRAYCVKLLCELHLAKVRPGCTMSLSCDARRNLRLTMHPDKDDIVTTLRALEFPLPTGKHVLEGEYTLMKKR